MSENESRKPRGRPRPPEVAAREDAILAELAKSGLKRNELAERLGAKPSLVWLALDRLRDRGLVAKCAAKGPEALWVLKENGPCP